VKTLGKQDLSGKNRFSDAAYELASQLLVAKLNLAAGAETCSGMQTAVMDGTGSYLPSNKIALRTMALNLASTLDKHNNGDVC
jgi:hypothetical protein